MNTSVHGRANTLQSDIYKNWSTKRAAPSSYLIIPASLQDKAINELHINHMGKEKNKNASMWINIVDQHEFWYRRSNQKLHHRFWLSGHMTQAQSNVAQNTREAIGICLS